MFHGVVFNKLGKRPGFMLKYGINMLRLGQIPDRRAARRKTHFLAFRQLFTTSDPSRPEFHLPVPSR